MKFIYIEVVGDCVDVCNVGLHAVVATRTGRFPRSPLVKDNQLIIFFELRDKELEVIRRSRSTVQQDNRFLVRIGIANGVELSEPF